MIEITIPNICKGCKWLENGECHFEGENYGTEFVGDRDDTECFEPKSGIMSRKQL